MTTDRRPTAVLLSPAEVVSRAYRSAIRGRYADANRWVLPALLESLRASHEGIRLAQASMKVLMERMEPSERRAELQDLLKTTEQVLPLSDGKQMWRNRRRGGDVVSFNVVRQTIRKKRAWVTISLLLKDGSVQEEQRVLQLTTNGWRIAEWFEKRRRTMQ